MMMALLGGHRRSLNRRASAEAGLNAQATIHAIADSRYAGGRGFRPELDFSHRLEGLSPQLIQSILADLPPVAQGLQGHWSAPAMAGGVKRAEGLPPAPMRRPNRPAISNGKQGMDGRNNGAAAPPPAPVRMVEADGQILFRDEQPERPAQRLSPADEQELLKMLRDGKTAADLRTFREGRGVSGTDNFDDVVAARDGGATLQNYVQYNFADTAPNRDGAVGAASRGFADPFNVLDELGAVVDSFGGTAGRESIFNSKRSIGDILYSNIDRNRSILQADERDHLGARLGGQLAGSIVLPIGNKAYAPSQLAKWGAAEGAFAGFGAGEGGPIDRLSGAAAGAGAGSVGGYALGRSLQRGGEFARRWLRPKPQGYDPDVALEPSASSGRHAVAQPSTPIPEDIWPKVGSHGPIHYDLAGNYEAAVARLQTDQTGMVPGLLHHPIIGDIDLVWGHPKRHGLAKLFRKHREVIEDLPRIIARLPVKYRPQEARNGKWVLEDDRYRAVISPDFHGVEQRWLVTAFELKDQ